MEADKIVEGAKEQAALIIEKAKEEAPEKKDGTGEEGRKSCSFTEE